MQGSAIKAPSLRGGSERKPSLRGGCIAEAICLKPSADFADKRRLLTENHQSVIPENAVYFSGIQCRYKPQRHRGHGDLKTNRLCEAASSPKQSTHNYPQISQMNADFWKLCTAKPENSKPPTQTKKPRLAPRLFRNL